MGLFKRDKKSKAAIRGAIAATLAVTVAALMGGCDYFNLRNSFLDPSQVGRFDRDTPWGMGQARPVVWPILDTLGVLDEPQLDWTNATDPTPADLVSKAEEQTLQAGDAVRVSIFELLQPGTDAITEAQIDDLGILTIKNLGKGGGRVQVSGLTPTQLEAKIAQILIENKILPPDPAPQVSVLLLQSQSRVFYMMGSASRPGTYNIIGNDFRLLKALALAGDIPVQSGNDYLYIIRQSPYDEKGGAAPGSLVPESTMPAAGGGGVPSGGDPLKALQNLDPTATNPMGTTPASGPGTAPTQPSAMAPRMIRPLPTAMSAFSAGQATHPDFDPAVGMPSVATTATIPATEAMTMPGMPGTMPQTPATLTGAVKTEGGQDFMYVDGKGWVPIGSASATAASSSEPSGDTGAQQTRVIRIPIKELREGVSKYNIVIRAGDIVQMPTLDLGEFYLMGNIARPGVYSLTGRKITLHMAVAAGGNFGPLALPRKCELIRRIGPDQQAIVQVNLQKIFDGTAPDIFLKSNDILNVGTDAIEPFFAVVRNAYRASYGWGFIYDKNLNTSDSNNSSGG